MKNKKTMLILGGFLVLFGIFYAIAFDTIKKNDPPLPVLGNPGHKVGDFSFLDQTGAEVTQQDLEGKVSVVEYFYSTCTAICPPMNENMSHVYETFKDTPGFQIFANTVDPDTDSVAVLAAYAKQFNADPKVWKFLTGSKKDLFHLANRGYLLNAADSVGVNGDYVHTQWFALVDQKRQIRGYYDGLKKKDIDRLKKDIETLLNS